MKTKKEANAFQIFLKKAGVFVKKNKITLIAVAAVLAVAIVVICIVSASGNRVRPIKPTEQELRTVGTVGGFEVPFEELRYLACNMAMSMSMADPNVDWKLADPQNQLIDFVNDAITYNYAVLSLCREVGLELGEEEILKSVQEEIELMVADEFGGKMDDYRAMLTKNYLTDHYVRFCYEIDKLTNELFYVYTQDLELFDYDDAASFLAHAVEDGVLLRTTHICVSGENALEKANECYEKLEAGADFDEMIGKYSSDYETTEVGYYFSVGEMNEDYENAALATAVGSYSAVTKCGEEYYIIKRLQPEDEFVTMNLDELFKYYRYAQMNGAIADRQAALSFDLNDYGKTLRYWALF
mgnify:CR=1 FL=1